MPDAKDEPSDVKQLLDGELALYLRRAQAALEFSPDFAERHRLAHLITLLRLEAERRARSGTAPAPSSESQAEKARDELRAVLGTPDDEK